MNIFVTEDTEHGEVPIDIYSKLAADRILFLHDYVNDNIAADILATLILKNAESTEEKISLFINSSGGDLRSIFMIYDAMQVIQAPIETFCVGSALNEAVLLLAGGNKGMRYATPNSLISLSQLLSEGTIFSDLSDAVTLMDRMKKDNKNFMASLAKCIGKPVKQLMSDFEREKFFTAKQAKQYGFIDHIVENSK